MSEKKKIQISPSLTYQTQAETLQVAQRQDSLSIGIPKEVIMQEKRIALVPSSVATLVGHGHQVIIEAGAGAKSNFSDHNYAEAGAEIAYTQDQVYKANVILKVAPPTLSEIQLMHPNQILISPLQLPIISDEYIRKLQEKRVIAVAMEYLKNESGTFPIVQIMSELAGLCAILTAAELLAEPNNGTGVLLGGISGVPPAKVVILGAGIVAEYASRTALGLGAEVRIFDDNVAKLKRIQTLLGRQLYTSTLNPVYLKRELLNADVAIGAIHSKSGRTPVVVTEDMIQNMKQGAVIVDISIDQGGCFETSEVTSHDSPTFIKHGVIHYCVPNIASKVSRTASISISNIISPILLQSASAGSVEQLLYQDYGLRHGVYIYKGWLTNEYLGRRFSIKSTNIDLLMTSSW
ncbi:MAG: alanine dehydrogenase [Saprospiraceae bacterium]|nr:alanine dehydrogenase [Saprospiraceae bacterium]